MPDFNDQVLLGLFGIVFSGMGLAARLGLWKGWYWRTRGGAYGYIPLGLLFLLYAWRTELTAFGTEIVFYGLFGLLLLLGIWWSFLPPDFVKPPWVRWVEEQPESVQEAMRDQVEEGEAWRSYVESREAVKQWARSLGKGNRKRRG